MATTDLNINQSLNLDSKVEHDVLETKANLEKEIELGEQLPKDNPKNLHDLAMAYNNLAILQYISLGDYDSANLNYRKSIEISEQLPKDNTGYQFTLAGAYTNLANLQENHLGDYGSAKSNYEKTIAIGEQLPKDNTEYQDTLASAYTNLADLQQFNLGDFNSANLNYRKAIEIREQLPKDNHENLNKLAKAYTVFANLQKDYLGNYDSAKVNYEKAIKFGEQLPKDNPEHQNNLAYAFYFYASLQVKQTKYEAAEANVKSGITIFQHLADSNPKFLGDLLICNCLLGDTYTGRNKLKEAKETLDGIKSLAAKCLYDNPNDSKVQQVNDYIKNLSDYLNEEKRIKRRNNIIFATIAVLVLIHLCYKFFTQPFQILDVCIVIVIVIVIGIRIWMRS